MGRFDILKKDNRENYEISSYKSDFDFEEFEITDDEIKQQITTKEEEIMIAGKQIAKKTLEVGRMLYEIQKILASHKTGAFVAWFKYMGLEKNFVYREIGRWELFQKYRKAEIAEASVRTLDFIKKQQEELEEEKITEILQDPKMAPERIKEIKENFEDSNPVNDEKNDTEAEIEKIKEKIEKYKEKIEKLTEKKRKLEEKIST